VSLSVTKYTISLHVHCIKTLKCDLLVCSAFLCLFVILACNVGCFTVSGSGDGFFSSAFQSELQGNPLHNASMPRRKIWYHVNLETFSFDCHHYRCQYVSKRQKSTKSVHLNVTSTKW